MTTADSTPLTHPPIPVSDTEALVLNAVMAVLQSSAIAVRSPTLNALRDAAYCLHRGYPDKAAVPLLGLRELLAYQAEREARKAVARGGETR